MKKLAVAGFLFFFGASGAFAYDAGGFAGAFLRMGVGARAIGMGGAFTAVPQSAAAGFYNPGGLPFLKRRQLAFSGGILALDRAHNFLGFATALHPGAQKKGAFDAGFSLAWVNSGVSNIDGRDADGRPQGTFSFSENAFLFSFAIQPLPRAALGFTAKLLYARMPDVKQDNSALSTRGLGLDFGLLVNPVKNLFLGAVLQDVRSKYSWNTEGVWERGTATIDHFPKVLRLGASYAVNRSGLVSFDARYNFKQGWRFYAGGEWVYQDRLIGRLGFSGDHVSFGTGIRLRVWRLDSELAYAYNAISVLPRGDQFLTWRVEF